jgi:hypothetical protein
MQGSDEISFSTTLINIASNPRIPGIPAIFWYQNPGIQIIRIPGFGTNILSISYSKCIANLVSSPYFLLNYSTHAQLAEITYHAQYYRQNSTTPTQYAFVNTQYELVSNN